MRKPPYSPGNLNDIHGEANKWAGRHGEGKHRSHSWGANDVPALNMRTENDVKPVDRFVNPRGYVGLGGISLERNKPKADIPSHQTHYPIDRDENEYRVKGKPL